MFLLGLLIATATAQPQAIVGRWVQDSPQVSWTFRADGSGFMERGTPKTTARFNWTLDGNILKLSTATGVPITYQIVSRAQDRLVIVNRRLAMEYTLRRE